MKESLYHIGLYSKNKNTVVLQASTNIDCLSCELLDYFDYRLTTKKHLHKNRYLLLEFLKTDPKYAKKYQKYKYIITE